MSLRLIIALVSIMAASLAAGLAYRACGADVDPLLRLEQYRTTAAGPAAWAKLYPVPSDRPALMASG